MNLISLFSQALTNKEYLSFEPSEGQASKKIVCGKEKKMRLQEFFKTLSEYLSNDAAQNQLSPQEAIQLKEYTARLYERYKQTSNKWPRQLLKILAKFTPSFLKRFLPACFSNQIEETEKATERAYKGCLTTLIEETEKATERAYQGCLTTLKDSIHGLPGFHDWFTLLDEELCSKLFQTDENGTRAIDNIHPDHLEKKEFIELIRIRNVAQANEFTSAWPAHWANKREDLNQIESLYQDLCKMKNPLEIKKHIFSQPLSSEEQMALLAVIISKKKIPLEILNMEEEELLELSNHLRYVDLLLLPIDLGQKIIKKLAKPYTLNLGPHAAYLQGLTSLEKCIELSCHGEGFTSLPNLPACKKLNCSKCPNLRSLPELPNCKYLDCNNCRSLTSLPELPNCTYLDCNNCRSLTSLLELPNCTYLKCYECLKLNSLPELPNCTELTCYDCPSLNSLPELPNCTYLECSWCPSLTSLPELPNCTELTCYDCPSLNSLPELPNCTKLTCSHCPSLTAIPELPNYTFLRCSHCSGLTSLPELPNCTILNCDHCSDLTSLPELPNCTRLNCGNCINLAFIPDLPHCQEIDFIGCTSLRTIPQLPPFATVYSADVRDSFLTGGRDRFLTGARYSYLFEVDVEELEKEPLNILLRLATIFQSGRPFPSIRYKEKGELNVAFDVGGVRRDFVGRLCKNLLNEASEGPTSQRLALDTQRFPLEVADGEAAYLSLGYLMGLCCRGVSQMKTGNIFPESLYDCMRISLKPSVANWSESAWTEANWRSFLLLKDKGMLWLIPHLFGENQNLEGLDQKQQEWLDALKEELDIAPEEFSHALLIEKLASQTLRELPKERLPSFSAWRYAVKMAEGIKKVVDHAQWQAIVQNPKCDLKLEIEGVLDKKQLTQHLTCQFHELVPEQIKTLSPRAVEENKAFLVNWINKATPNALANFVRFVAGSPTLQPNQRIKMILTEQSSDHLPNPHTCFYTLDLPYNYPSQGYFDAKLEKAIKESLSGSGFGLA